MERQASSGLRTTFLVHAILGAIAGLGLLLIPETVGDIFSMNIESSVPNRLVGAAILGYAASSALAFRETLFEKVKIVVQLEIVWSVLAALVCVWGIITAYDIPSADPNQLQAARLSMLVFAVVFAAFAVAFGFFYTRE